MRSHPGKSIVGVVIAAALIGLVAIVIVINRSPGTTPTPEAGSGDRAGTNLGSSGGSTESDSGPESIGDTAHRPWQRGVHAVLQAGDLTVSRSLPAMSFHLEPDAALDARLPAGPFTGEFTVGFHGSGVREAFLARVRGGQLIIRYEGTVIASDHATSDEERLVMSSEPIAVFGPRQITYEMIADETGPTALRGVWRPVDPTTGNVSMVPLPIPSSGAPLVDTPELEGMVLAQKLACARCHESGDPHLQNELLVATPPDLAAVAGRARPDWLGQWIVDPASLRRRSEMPAILGDGVSPAMVKDLVHFLMSLGEPVGDDPAVLDDGLIATGRKHYAEVGCLACHGPLEQPEDRIVSTSRFADLGRLASKTSIDALTEFLQDPLAVRPSGQMPHLGLDETKARAIATYLVDRSRADGHGDTPATWSIDQQGVERGRFMFSTLRCNACHEVGADVPPLAPPRPAQPLESLPATSTGGCLAEQAAPGVPHYDIDDRQRDALRAFLAGLDDRRTVNVPWDHVALTMDRLRCTSCHSFYGESGPGSDVSDAFTTLGDADLGDEGRIPPDLTHVGSKLNTPWLQQVLQDGARARPYLATAMPRFGASVERLPAALAHAGGLPTRVDDGPPFDRAHAEAGRDLVGDTGMNCIQCHNIADRPATGTAGPDLVDMVERLRYEAFNRWLHDPSQLRVGTRMPSFFVAGRSAFTQHFDGDADEQVAAIWSYLSQGDLLPLPEGLVDPAGFTVDVVGEPVVLRTYMKTAGVRAIACGFPEQIHCAFDADACRLAAIWQGQFINAAGAWAVRGGSETNPEAFLWEAGVEMLLRPVDRDETFATRFRGYRLDTQRRPIFRYDLVLGDVVMTVEEQPVPSRTATTSRLQRRFVVQGGADASLAVHAGDLVMTSGDGQFETQTEGVTVVTLDASGTATFQVEVSW